VHASTVQVDDLGSESLLALASDQPQHGYTLEQLTEFSRVFLSPFSELEEREPASAPGSDLEKLYNADIISEDKLPAVHLAPLPSSDGFALSEVNEPHQQKRQLQLQKVSML
jgi:hypothetical protein